MNNNAYLLINPLKESSLDLANKIKKHTSGKVVLAPNIAAAQLYLQQELFDAIFLTLTNDQDIQSLIYQLPSSIPIVVVSPIKELASSAYEYENIVDFLLQPSCEARVWRALNRAQYTPILSNTRIEDSYAFIRSETQILKFNFNEIEYFSAFGSYSKVHTKNNVHIVNESIEGLMNILPSGVFRRVHHAYLINIYKITAVDSRSFFVYDRDIPIGKSYQKSINFLFNVKALFV